MGKYTEYLKQDVIDQSKDLICEIHDFEKDGSIILGRLVNIVPYHSEKFNKDQKKYIIDTDDGLKSVLLNQNADNSIGNGEYNGRIIYIRYEGKIKISDNKDFKTFVIKLIEEKPEV